MAGYYVQVQNALGRPLSANPKRALIHAKAVSPKLAHASGGGRRTVPIQQRLDA